MVKVLTFTPKRKVLFIVFSLIFLLSCASAQVVVTISPLDGSTDLYVDETKFYKISVVNTSAQAEKNIELRVLAPPELSILVDGSDRSERFYTFLALATNREEIKTLEIKGAAVSENSELKVEYSYAGTSEVLTSKVVVRKSPMLVESELSTGSIKPGEQASVVFSLLNDSNELLENINVELFSSGGVIVEQLPFELDQLTPGSKAENKQLDFTVDSEVDGKKLFLRVFFDDSKGTHVLEKSFALEVSQDSSIVFLIIAAIIIVLIYYFHRRGFFKIPRLGGDLGGEHDFSTHNEPKHNGKWSSEKKADNHGDHH